MSTKYEVALKGKPNTAMTARGGFRELSNDELMAAVDYMVARAGLNPGLQPDAPRAIPLESVAPPAAAVEPAAAPVDDRNIATTIVEWD